MTSQRMKDWREDDGLSSITEYEKRFALFPKTCTDGTKVWLKNYYVVYVHWGWKGQTKVFDNDHSVHTDKVEDIPEDVYLVRKLTEGF